jgi:hypothetical protein
MILETGEAPEEEIKCAQQAGIHAQMLRPICYTYMHESKTSHQYGGLKENPPTS